MPEVRFLRSTEQVTPVWNSNHTERGGLRVGWDPLTFAGPQVSSLRHLLAWLSTQEAGWLQFAKGRIHSAGGWQSPSTTRPRVLDLDSTLVVMVGLDL